MKKEEVYKVAMVYSFQNVAAAIAIV